MRVATRHPLAAGACGALLIAFSAVLVRLADVTPSTAAAFRCLYALPALGLLAAAERRRLGPRDVAARRAAWLAGAFFAADLVAWHHAIAAVGAGLATVLANLQVVVVGLVAWAVLGERPAPRTLLAVPVVLVGVVLISGVLGADPYGDNPPLGALYGAVTALAYSGFILLLRHGNRGSVRPAGPLFDATLVAAVLTLAFGAATGELTVVPSWPAHGWLVLLALNSQVVGWLLISTSLPRLPAVVTSVLLLLQPVGSVALGIVLLRESPSLVQLAGAATILAGVLLATQRASRSVAEVPAVGEHHRDPRLVAREH